MKVSLTFSGKDYTVDFMRPLDISIPVRFDGGEQLCAFGAPAAKREPYKDGDFTGSVAKGGSCNCDVYTLIPHCNGTHTECVGHITEEPVHIHDILECGLMPAALLTVMPESAKGCGETYGGTMAPDDLVITKKALEEMPIDRNIRALVVRTLPNDDGKITRDYSDENPPYFTLEAMEYIATSGFRHLVIDTPSVDRLDDGGALANHRLFWGLEEGDKVEMESLPIGTITELVYVPDEIADGFYVLNLQAAPFLSDAAPSRPVLYEAEEG